MYVQCSTPFPSHCKCCHSHPRRRGRVPLEGLVFGADCSWWTRGCGFSGRVCCCGRGWPQRTKRGMRSNWGGLCWIAYSPRDGLSPGMYKRRVIMRRRGRAHAGLLVGQCSVTAVTVTGWWHFLVEVIVPCLHMLAVWWDGRRRPSLRWLRLRHTYNQPTNKHVTMMCWRVIAMALIVRYNRVLYPTNTFMVETVYNCNPLCYSMWNARHHY